MRRITSVAFESRTYLSLAYILIRLPLAFLYLTIVSLALSRGVAIATLILLVPAALAVWAAVLVRRTLRKR